MENTTLYIKNMVCPRCISTVTRVLNEAGLPVQTVTLGEAHIEAPAALDAEALDIALQKEGFALIYDREKQIAEKIKAILIDLLFFVPVFYAYPWVIFLCSGFTLKN